MDGSILSQLGADGRELAAGGIAALTIYLAVIVATRLAGLRSFAKMSAFDFAMTVAIGSLIASAASGQAPLATVLTGVVVLYLAQYVVAQLRRHGLLRGAVDNAPLLLMESGRILEHNLAVARITPDDLRARLRQANVVDLTRVRAVVFETTGDVSVLQGDGELDPELLRGVTRD